MEIGTGAGVETGTGAGVETGTGAMVRTGTGAKVVSETGAVDTLVRGTKSRFPDWANSLLKDSVSAGVLKGAAVRAAPVGIVPFPMGLKAVACW